MPLSGLWQAVKAAQSTEVTWTVVDTTMPSPPTKQAWGVQSPSPKKPPKPRAPMDAERNRVTRPNTSWDDVVGLGQVKTELQQIARELKGGPALGGPIHTLVRPAGLRQGFAGGVSSNGVGPRRFGDGPRGRVAFRIFSLQKRGQALLRPS